MRMIIPKDSPKVRPVDTDLVLLSLRLEGFVGRWVLSHEVNKWPSGVVDYTRDLLGANRSRSASTASGLQPIAARPHA